MAAGGGRGTGVAFSKEGEQDIDDIIQGGLTITQQKSAQRHDQKKSEPDSGDETGSEISGSDFSSTTSESDNDFANQTGRKTVSGADEIWSGGVSCVVGLQKRGLRGLMEGRRARERGQTNARGSGGVNGTPASGSGPNAVAGSNITTNGIGVGLGIA